MEKPKVRKAVVTDGGYATRFLPVTKTLPKCMIPIMDKPITHYIIEECMAASITEIIIVATEEGKPIYEDYFHNTVHHIYETLNKQGKSARFDKVREVFSLPNIIVTTQNKNLPYGNATPLLSAFPYLGDEPFLYVAADDYIFGPSACKEIVDAYHSSDDKVKGIMGVEDIPGVDVTKYGIVKIKEGTEDELDHIIEKPSVEEAPTTMVNISRFLFTPDIFDHLSANQEDHRGKDNELWIADAVQRLSQAEKVLVKPISGHWMTTGDPMNYLKTTIEFVLKSDHYNGDFEEFLREKVKELDDQLGLPI